ncbi:uncharacterized protein LOC142234475 [Haematobia irritans]|uniref:uncharacterized protein LOC142223366 n=1 Tax=Haematobia irritans TaxID=7368 RepID=UPI003F508419
MGRTCKSCANRAPLHRNCSISWRQGKRSEEQHQFTHSNHSVKHFGCGLCRENHSLSSCSKYRHMNLIDKYKTVMKLHYCVNCLARNHLQGKCQSHARCNICKEKHHTSLHGHKRIWRNESTAPRIRSHSPPQLSSKRPNPVSCNILRTVLPTALIKVHMGDSTKFVRALMNSSLSSTIIAARLIEEYELKTFTVDSLLYTRLSFEATVPTYPAFQVNARVTETLPREPYAQSLSETILDKFPRIELADPKFISNNPIYIEIGADLFPAIMKSNIMQAEGGLLMAQDSTLGWLVIGSATS